MAIIEISCDPTDRELRQFAGIWLPASLGIIGAAVLFKWDAVTAAVVLWSVAVVVAAVGLRQPQSVRWVYLGWMRAVYPIGWTVSHLILAVVFYLVMTPVGLIMRLVGYDPMHRKPDESANTYWVKHHPGGHVKRYFRQF